MNVFATASLRNIKNTDEVLAAIRERTGLVVEVLSGELEARYGCLGRCSPARWKGARCLTSGEAPPRSYMLDNGRITRAESLDIGSLNLYNRYVSELWPDRGEIEKIAAAARKKLRRAPAPAKPVPNVLAIGGTARAVLKIANQYLDKPEGNRILTMGELDRTTEMLLAARAPPAG